MIKADIDKLTGGGAFQIWRHVFHTYNHLFTLYIMALRISNTNYAATNKAIYIAICAC